MELNDFSRRSSSDPDFVRGISAASNEAATSLFVGDVVEKSLRLDQTIVVHCEPSTTGEIVKLAGSNCAANDDSSAFAIWLYPDFMLSNIPAAEIDYSSRSLYHLNSRFHPGKYIIFDLNAPKLGYEYITEDRYEECVLIEAAFEFSAIERYSVKSDGQEVGYCYRFA